MRSKPTRPLILVSRLFALLFLLLAGLVVSPAQTGSSPHQYTDERWEDLREELDYSGQAPTPKKAKDPEKKSAEAPSPRSERSEWDFHFGEEWSMLMKVLLFTILGTLLVLLVYTFLKNSEKRFLPEATALAESENTEKHLSLEALVEQLDTAEIAPHIREAEAQQRYDLAVRLQFLAVLQRLHQGGYIRWKKDRTNRVYLQQLYGQAPYDEFRILSLIFERCWYGRAVPDASAYVQLKGRYEQFITQLQAVSTS